MLPRSDRPASPDAGRHARAYVSTLAPWAIAPLDAGTTERAWDVQDKAKLTWWDSLMVAAALRAECRLFVSEDMHDGPVVDGMRIANPFNRGIRSRSWAANSGTTMAVTTTVLVPRGSPQCSRAARNISNQRAIMGFKCGIVGLPNVGKSTLFNALTQTAAAEAANYPFCTIEPNVGEVGVPDERLDTLARVGKSAKIIPTRLTFVDIAGLVRGASKGEGLGNQFLSHIREVDAVAYVLRCFEDGDITHVEGRIDPVADADTVETELMLADLDSLEKRVSNLEKKAKQGDKEAKAQLGVVEKMLPLLREGKPARMTQLTDEEAPIGRALQLLTSKPVRLRVQCRRGLGGERQQIHGSSRRARQGRRHRLRHHLGQDRGRARRPEAEERTAFLAELGLKEAGLNRLIREGYRILDLITYFTVGPKEARAWTVTRGHQGPQGRRRDPHRLREGLHPRRDDRLRRLRRARR